MRTSARVQTCCHTRAKTLSCKHTLIYTRILHPHNPSASCTSTLFFTELISPPSVCPPTHLIHTHPTQLPPRSRTNHSPAAGHWDSIPLATHCHRVHTRPEVSTTTMFTHAEARIRRQQAYAQSRPPRPPVAQAGNEKFTGHEQTHTNSQINPPRPTTLPNIAPAQRHAMTEARTLVRHCPAFELLRPK